jgi:hypothetical protein
MPGFYATAVVEETAPRVRALQSRSRINCLNGSGCWWRTRLGGAARGVGEHDPFAVDLLIFFFAQRPLSSTLL